MALDQRKRQKQAEKRKARQKARQQALISQHRNEISLQLKRSAAAPILHCCVTKELWQSGLGQLLFSRHLPTGDVAYTIYLLDVYCLGVKDVVLGVSTWVDYQERIVQRMLQFLDFVDLTAEGARKIVEGAVAFAGNLGFPPPADYQKAQLLFGSVDASACPEEFRFGLNGKPCFMPGLHDGSFRCQQITTQLTKKLGADGFDYVMPVGGLSDLDFDDDDDDFDDE